MKWLNFFTNGGEPFVNLSTRNSLGINNYNLFNARNDKWPKNGVYFQFVAVLSRVYAFVFEIKLLR